LTSYKGEPFDLLTDYFKSPVEAGTLELQTDKTANMSLHMLMEDSRKDAAN